jgi:anti-anti-sigma factor
MSDHPPDLEVTQESRTLSDGREAVIVAPVGDIDLATAEEFSAAFRSPRTDGAEGLVLDLRGVRFIDSSGLRVILIAAQKLGGRLATVVPADSPVAMLVDLAGVADRVNPVSDEEEALARIERAGDYDAG